METKAYKINDYWIWAFNFEAAKQHYDLIMRARTLSVNG